jgi:hypothetical protein
MYFDENKRRELKVTVILYEESRNDLNSTEVQIMDEK